jgi:hypothetical protein
MLLALLSKYVQNLTTSHHSTTSPKYHHLSPGFLLEPLFGFSTLFLTVLSPARTSVSLPHYCSNPTLGLSPSSHKAKPGTTQWPPGPEQISVPLPPIPELSSPPHSPRAPRPTSGTLLHLPGIFLSWGLDMFSSITCNALLQSKKCPVPLPP